MILINGKYRPLIKELSKSDEIKDCPEYDEGLMEKVLWSIGNDYLEDDEIIQFKEILYWGLDNNVISYPLFTYFEVEGLRELSELNLTSGF